MAKGKARKERMKKMFDELIAKGCKFNGARKAIIKARKLRNRRITPIIPIGFEYKKR